ncbi:MAG: 50S ribosomal protein L25 [Chloroflexi bacterium]|nr:50S ribosomal protein L25 [Chloroflexota bacterium]
MDNIVLKASRREISGKKVKTLRLEAKLPAILYGKSTEPLPITLDLKKATQILKSTSSSSLLTVDVEGEEFTTLVRERQRDFILGTYLHIDFLVVSLTETVRAKVNIVLEGEAPAISDYESLLIYGLEQVEVESLPQDLPERITVDISVLEVIGDGIYVRDLIPPANVSILDDPEEMIVVVTSQVVEEEEEELEEEELLLEGEPGVVGEGEAEEDGVETEPAEEE